MTQKKREIVGGRTKFKSQMSKSSKEYLLRQAKDPYVKKAIKEGYHSRAAYKLKEINDKHKIIRPGMVVVDLGAAPGGWCQVVKEEMAKGGRGLGGGKIFGLDKIWMEDVEEVEFIKGDFTENEIYEQLLEKCPEKINVVLSDMAPETSGHDGTDHLRIMGLVEMAADFALNTLKPKGTFLTKIFQGGEEIKFREQMRKHFDKVQFIKPKSSRKESREVFLLCTGFKG
ncbi:MAG: rRNA methyltransferase [Magnetococcales bacterium]|nr:rRNA methyltransferase [Magnetococcales bacterium]MEC8067315.1 RlmE family RNA methyltransferase [Pseudomonadota bacterium]|tara:strand:+ start:50848 stop:51531 length:684 start_codon:yes stop_codon:yes gene_type:complete